MAAVSHVRASSFTISARALISTGRNASLSSDRARRRVSSPRRSTLPPLFCAPVKGYVAKVDPRLVSTSFDPTETLGASAAEFTHAATRVSFASSRASPSIRVFLDRSSRFAGSLWTETLGWILVSGTETRVDFYRRDAGGFSLRGIQPAGPVERNGERYWLFLWACCAGCFGKS